MSKYKVGDKVRCLHSPVGGDKYVGDIVTVSKVCPNGTISKIKEWDESWSYMEHWFEIIKKSNNTPNTIMKKLTNYYKKLTDENTQVLVKAGYLNGDLEPTEKATEAIKEIQFFALKDELVVRAKAEIAEEETKNK